MSIGNIIRATRAVASAASRASSRSSARVSERGSSKGSARESSNNRSNNSSSSSSKSSSATSRISSNNSSSKSNTYVKNTPSKPDNTSKPAISNATKVAATISVISSSIKNNPVSNASNNVSNSTKNTTTQNQNNKNQLAPNVDIKAIQESAKNSTKYKEITSEKIYKVLTSYETSVATTAAGELPNVVEKLKDLKILRISDKLLKLSKTVGKTATAVSLVSNVAVAVNDSSYFKRDLAQINILGTLYGGVFGSRVTSGINYIAGKAYDNAIKSDVKWQRDMASFLDNHAMSKAQEERSKFLTAGLRDGSLVANTQNKRIYSIDKITIVNERANKEIRKQAGVNLNNSIDKISNARADYIKQGIESGDLKVDTQHKNIYNAKNTPKNHERDNPDIKKQAAQNAKQLSKDKKKDIKNKIDEKKFQNMENIKNGNVDMQHKRLNGKSSNKNKPSGPNNRQ